MRRLRGSVLWLVLSGLAVCVVAAAALIFVSGEETSDSAGRAPPPPVVEIERDGLRYAFHLPTGQASLFDVENDPHSLQNLIDDRPEDALRLRRELSRELEVETLEELREHYRGSINDLRRLGYL